MESAGQNTPLKVPLTKIKNFNFLTKIGNNSKTAYRSKKIFTASEAQRKITPDKVPQVNFCSDDFFNMLEILPVFGAAAKNVYVKKSAQNIAYDRLPVKYFQNMLSVLWQILRNLRDAGWNQKTPPPPSRPPP